MNQSIVRLFAVVCVLFGGLAAATGWWTVIKADELSTQRPQQNPRALLRGLKTRRGAIRDADGVLIARSVRRADGVYVRRYPTGELFGHPVGYSLADLGLGQFGLEASRGADLAGRVSGLANSVQAVLGRRPEATDVQTNLVAEAQRVAMRGIARAGGSGSAVALDPRTGAVSVLASVPGFDPGAITTGRAFSKLSTDAARRPLVDRALQFGEAPGSTFKVLTSVAAIDSGRFTPDSQVDGRSGRIVSGRPLANDFNESFTGLSLRTALAKSVNTAFAGVAEDLGKPTIAKYMERFGFGAKPDLDYPRDAMSSSAVVPVPPGRPVPATSRFVDVGRVGIGQGGLQVTTLQMAQVAAAVANGGDLMRPRLVARLIDRDGRTVENVRPVLQRRVMRRATATAVTGMMEGVVTFGTGTAAQIPGVAVAGKTGTAETLLGAKVNDVWFIGFAPSRAPRVAVAVNVQDVVGFGGEIAAPIARDIMKVLLARSP